MYDAENSFFMLNRSIFVCASQGKYNGNTFFKSKKIHVHLFIEANMESFLEVKYGYYNSDHSVSSPVKMDRT
ncbi:hypothetical protein ATC1_1229 [Flexilinea flocculi]|jgi:hypothetical protein|uniref:Uncharacterized protein n=1 Tax=Flexilinea flocculi TaxID=1678840 RepID=A0A0K8PBH6_9CHLR|nr:hypothetical protein ATC1_1229 [Flexilinea flocculi]